MSTLSYLFINAFEFLFQQNKSLLLSLILILMTMCSFSFNVNPEETFAEMNKEVEEYSYLVVTPPLQLKEFGVDPPRLILLSHGN